MKKANEGAPGLVKVLREIFVTYGIAAELSSDGGPEFIVAETRKLLENWGSITTCHRAGDMVKLNDTIRYIWKLKLIYNMNLSPSQ